MSRMLGYCLTLGTTNGWADFSYIAAVRLSETERAVLATAALNSLKTVDAITTAAAAIGSVGGPLPAFLGGMSDARFWSSIGTRSELKAYALAAYEAMNTKDQVAFFQHINEEDISA